MIYITRQLSEVFEKHHAVNPMYLLEPGVVKESNDTQPQPVEQKAGGSDEPVHVPSAVQQPQSGPSAAKKSRKNKNVTEALLSRLDEAERNRAERHKEFMASRVRHEALLERLVVAAENYFSGSSRQQSEAE
ncbi:uncharacterized protein LOC119382405 [Rhipicephalus sanguineus]|uniref:uncharacterized protein LOC119382405 n=1 Tax=Rhipicephalus sanguineus TaxID=34632 RepID=UPI0020C26268|nr:uncharacterized protein LOC119382405 [Rhipicephalus sanguineus]